MQYIRVTDNLYSLFNSKEQGKFHTYKGSGTFWKL